MDAKALIRSSKQLCTHVQSGRTNIHLNKERHSVQLDSTHESVTWKVWRTKLWMTAKLITERKTIHSTQCVQWFVSLLNLCKITTMSLSKAWMQYAWLSFWLPFLSQIDLDALYHFMQRRFVSSRKRYIHRSKFQEDKFSFKFQSKILLLFQDKK